MIRFAFILLFVASHTHSFCQTDSLETEKWKRFFNERAYEKKALRINDDTFWEVNDSYTYYTEYPLLLIYSDGTSRTIKWSFEGLDYLIDKKKAITDVNFERYEKENLEYIVFDGLLLKNPLVGNMIAGDFMIVYKRGPVSIYREYFTSPITRDAIESVLSPYYLSEAVSNFHLGSLKKKLMKLVEDYPRLSKKIKDEIIGYREDDDDIIRIADEFNQWTKENYPYRYADHTAMFWQDPGY